MPYNATAIPPRKEPTGQTQLPLTRVRKIISLDPDVSVCSNNAAFVITLATELFIQYLASESQNMVKLDRKPRRNVQYKDVSNAASRIDRLEFLQDVVPATISFGKIKGDAAAAQARLRGDTNTATKSVKADRTSLGSATAPTAIASLTNDGQDTEEEAVEAGTGGGRKKKQKLPFSVLSNRDQRDSRDNRDNRDRDRHSHHEDLDPADGSGVAAATALAQAAAASGATEEESPNDQLQQDMLRMQDADVEMQDS